ncbi:DUF6479 family protein [Actinacidiphila paucisporea]|uniref:Uncharacterized protein n=1 Tax=Actinacidiphila paucisporea TaxID=310782 RepID=A0A1M7LSA0_9ACTN|nr:DUF6479 family protein [Actinacidiphila paucisporea]SHM80947.1 hypothetical protein SAMN05216499_114152 [Actinacidiphila paucisporea]
MYAATTQPLYLAGATGAGWATAIGVCLVALIISAFWFGARRTRRRPMPPQEPQPRAGSWHEPSASETHHSAGSSDDRHQQK